MLQKKMIDYKNEALAILDVYPDNIYKKAMIELVNYAIDRKY